MLIVAAILAILVYGIIASLLGTILPALSQTFNLSNAQSGTVALAQALGLVVASVSVGPLIDAKGKKTALLLGLALIAASLFGIPNAAGYGSVTLCWSVLGLGGGIIVTAANALASDVSENRRASVLNLLNLFFGLGGLLTPFIAANLLGGNAMTMAYVAGALAAVTLIVHIMTPIPKPTGARAGFNSGELGQVAKRPVLYLLALYLFLYVACEVGVWNWLPKYLIASGVPESRALNILSLGFALGLLIGRVAVSPILIKVASATVTLFAAVLMAITTFIMLQTSSPGTAWIAVFCAGLAMAPVFPTTLAMVGDAFPRMTATAMGFVITCGWIGLAVSSPIIGNVASGSSLNTALYILPVFSVAMILVNLALRPMLRPRAVATLTEPTR